MQYLIEFQHDSKFLGIDGMVGMLLVKASSFEEACSKVETFSVEMTNSATGYKWNEYFRNARNFVNLTVE